MGVVVAGALGGALGGAFAPVAQADDQYVSPSVPIIRNSDRGIVMSGVGDERMAEMLKVHGGVPSAGAPIPIHDGGTASLPKVGGAGPILCTKGWNGRSTIISC